MASKVNTFLNFDTGCAGESELIAIGQNNANGSFLIHHIISSAIKEKRCVCLLSFVQKFHHYNSISRKLGVNLQTAQSAKQFVFLDGLDVLLQTFFVEDCSSACHKNIGVFRKLREEILSTLSRFMETFNSVPLVIIDDVSVLVSLGFGSDSVGIFVNTLISEVIDRVIKIAGPQETGGSKIPSIVILSSYSESDRESVYLWKLLSHISSISVNVTGLETGYCKDVHGQVNKID